MPKREQLKVMTLFGTRPEIIRLSRVFAELDKYVDHIMVHTGQSYDYEMSKIFFDELEIRKPDYFLDVKAPTLGQQIGNIIIRCEEVLLSEMPDALLILGDTNSALASIPAKRMKIPIFHMEAGNRCFDENVPEEINRRIVDHISDINLPYTEHARGYLLREGIHPGTMFVTGSPLNEVMLHFKAKIERSSVLKEQGVTENNYFIASTHREENVDSKEHLEEILAVFDAVAKKWRLPVLVTTHPRTAKRLEEYGLKKPDDVRFCKPFGYFDYMRLQQGALCVISDSGTILEEASLLGFPAVQIRNSSERPEAYDEGVAILTGLDRDIILQSVDTIIRQWAAGGRSRVPASYQVTNVSSKIVRHITGLTKIVKRRRLV